jgi:hypothetical protein
MYCIVYLISSAIQLIGLNFLPIYTVLKINIDTRYIYIYNVNSFIFLVNGHNSIFNYTKFLE